MLESRGEMRDAYISPVSTPLINHSSNYSNRSRTREAIVSLSTILSLSDERRDYFTTQPIGFIYKCKEYKDLVKLWKSPPAFASYKSNPYGWNWISIHVDRADFAYTPILYRSYNGGPYCINSTWNLNRILQIELITQTESVPQSILVVDAVSQIDPQTCATDAVDALDAINVDTNAKRPYSSLIERIVENNAYTNQWSYSCMRPLERFFADVYMTDAIQAREDFEKKYAAVEINWTRF